jgi:putative IMPACT (imprinted ancient) family translation regulator
MGNVGLVVARYFGGIKLDAGGLVRAYSQSAIQMLETREHVVCQPMSLLFSYHLQGKVEHYLNHHDIEITNK